MSGLTQIDQDDSRLSRLDILWFRLESILNLVAGITIFLLVMLAVTNVLGRWLFNTPVSGYIDWVEQFMAIFAFLGLAYCQRLGGHIRMDILLRQFKGRILWLAELLSCLLMLIISLLLTYGSWLHFQRAWKIGDSSIDIGLPTWPAKLVVPVALSVLVVRLLLQIWAYGRALVTGTAPIGVPKPLDAAEQADEEAQLMEERQND